MENEGTKWERKRDRSVVLESRGGKQKIEQVRFIIFFFFEKFNVFKNLCNNKENLR